MGRFYGLIALAIAALAASAHAVTTTLNPTRDNAIYQNASSTSDGAGEAFYAGRTQQSDTNIQIRRGLIFFNLSSLPSNATVTSATLRLVAENRSANGNRTTSLRKLLQDWGEGTSVGSGQGAGAANNDATWVYRFYNPANPSTSPTWTTPGGSFATSNSATATCPDAGGPFTFNGPAASLMVSDLQSWINNPASNFGWEILGDESTSATAKKIYSRQYFNSANRPLLTINYVVPEPAGLLAISTLALTLLRRNRHPRS